jgi:hypothetical protein
MPRIAVEPPSLTDAARRLTAVARDLHALAGSFGGKTAGLGAAAGIPDVESAADDLRSAWTTALHEIAAAAAGFAANTDAAAVVYEAADRLPAPKPPPPPPKAQPQPLFPWDTPSNLEA